MRPLQLLKFLIGCTMVFAFYLGFIAIMNPSNNKQIRSFQVREKKVLLDENNENEEININIVKNKEKIIFMDIIPKSKKINISNNLEKPDNLVTLKMKVTPEKLPDNNIQTDIIKDKITTNSSISNIIDEQKVIQTTKLNTNVTRVVNEKDHTSAPIHVFYYPWYGIPKFDNGSYYHWNHHVLKKWDDPSTVPSYTYQPPYEIASVYYPLLGPYSSRDPEIINKHMKMISSAGIDAIAVSWFPKDISDSEGKPWEDIIQMILDTAIKYKLKVTFHLEPYKGRTIENVYKDIVYIIDKYGNHSGLYKMKPKKIEVNKGSSFEKDAKDIAKLEKPVFYIYDSYLIDSSEWSKLTLLNGSLTIRHSRYDSILIGLLVNESDQLEILKAGFDGIYTYFASDGFTYGSTMNNWKNISEYCEKNDLLFVPSVGPGYNDERVRPWNQINTKKRNGGEYYKEHFKGAHTARADIVSITSFNEWHEGTQIEPAVPYTDSITHPKHPFIYEAYSKEPEQYLHITLEMIKQYFTPHSKDIEVRLEAIV
ncbi:Glycoside hydrolase, superfamily domain-containing protein [Strongyloides ratti]|uniref:Glycoside hydrolase, superfamily domain-containing protein n=1 Tax=Strongyloides ratti TaxID=34506 RepID=A0A090MXI1_STRRB|nr:Glycoside hydrolase, superfamily domain-containing protein [Strongyloides ratti]CEF65474.1 Glycoside hydrolase, superfamily domain-containing protein [Strongyloides ratti]